MNTSLVPTSPTVTFDLQRIVTNTLKVTGLFTNVLLLWVKAQALNSLRVGEQVLHDKYSLPKFSNASSMIHQGSSSLGVHLT